MAKVDTMGLMASSAKSIMNTATKQNLRKVESSSDSFGQYFAKREDVSVEQTPVKKEDAAKESTFSGQPKANILKKKEYVSDLGNGTSSENIPAGGMSIEQASAVVSEIRQIVKNELGTDDAAIDQTLKAMELTVMDLFNPDTLKAFVLQLKGAESMDFLTDELLLKSFQGVMEFLNDYSEENQNGILAFMELFDTQMPLEELTTSEEFQDFMKQLTGDADAKLMAMPEGTEETIEVSEDNGFQTEQGRGFQMLVQPEKVTAEKEAMTEEKTESEDHKTAEKFSVISTEKKQEDMEQSGDSGMNRSGEQKKEESMELSGVLTSTKTETAEETEEAVAEPFKDTEEADILKDIRHTEHEQTPLFAGNNHPHVIQGKIGQIAEANFQSASRMLQVLEITRQVSVQMRTSLNEGMTRLEMQLNPESLGKVLLTVSAKEGVMTATFRVQTEDARQALESQMFTLRENLEAKNIKVEAVDVQISNFDFTANEEAKRQAEEEMAKKGKKNFDFSAAEEEPDETEISAEEVRRSVMRDRGGSIDFTA